MATKTKELYKNEFQGPSRLTPEEVEAQVKRRRARAKVIKHQNATAKK